MADQVLTHADMLDPFVNWAGTAHAIVTGDEDLRKRYDARQKARIAARNAAKPKDSGRQSRTEADKRRR
jgi:hypothetical protein